MATTEISQARLSTLLKLWSMSDEPFLSEVVPESRRRPSLLGSMLFSFIFIGGYLFGILMGYVVWG